MAAGSSCDIEQREGVDYEPELFVRQEGEGGNIEQGRSSQESHTTVSVQTKWYEEITCTQGPG